MCVIPTSPSGRSSAGSGGDLPRMRLLGTWVNSDGHRAHCVILSGCSRARPARGSDRGRRQRAAQATACPSSWPCSSFLHLLRGAAFAVSVGVATLDLISFEQYVWFLFVGVVAATVAFYLIGA